MVSPVKNQISEWEDELLRILHESTETNAFSAR